MLPPPHLSFRQSVADLEEELALAMAVQFELVEGGGALEQLRRGRQLLRRFMVRGH